MSGALWIAAVILLAACYEAAADGKGFAFWARPAGASILNQSLPFLQIATGTA